MKGQIIPIFAIFGSILVGFAALGIDTANNSAMQLKLQDAARAVSASLAHAWSSPAPTQSSIGTLTSSTTMIQNAVNIAAFNGVSATTAKVCTAQSGGDQFDAVYFDSSATVGTGTTAAACESSTTGWTYAVEVQVPPIATPTDVVPPQCSPNYNCVGIVTVQKVWQYIPVQLFGTRTTSVSSAADSWDGITPSTATSSTQVTIPSSDAYATDTQQAATCPSSAVCWYSGRSGKLHVWTGNQATLITSGTGVGNTNKLNGISCSTSSQCYAAGVNGTILSLVYSGGTYSVNSSLSAGSPDFGAVSCTPSGYGTKCLVVDAGNTSEYGGASWTQVSENEPTNALLGVSCVSDTSCLAVGQNGAVDYFNGTAWTVQTSFAGSPQMNAISCVAGTTSCWAVGNGGLIYYTSSLSTPSWTQEATAPSLTTANLYGISCPSTSICVVAGASGTLLHTLNGGSTWIADGSGTGQDLYSVSCADITFCTEAGNSGEIAQTHLPIPSISSISPSSGTSGTSVTITGKNFNGATAVKFGATNASGSTIVSATTITATVPSGTGTVDITVTGPNGTSPTSSADQFTYAGGGIPSVTLIGSDRGPTTGGQFVMIAGTNFTGATAVKFGTTSATSFTVDSANLIAATVPAASAGTVDITVTTGGGTSATSSADQYTFYAAGPLYGWGENDDSELGTAACTPSPCGSSTYVTATGESSGVIMTGSGMDQNFLINSSGAVYGVGLETAGALGNGVTSGTAASYTAVSGLTSGFVEVQGMAYGGIGLKSDGTVWDWGDDYYGENGNGASCAGGHPTEPCAGSSTPVQVTGLTGVVQISATGHTGIALKNDGSVWTWGASPYGELGNGTTTNSTSAFYVNAGADSSCGTYLCNIVAISGGGGHVLALDQNGAVWSWGRNNAGQLGNNTITNSSSPVAVSGLSSGVKAIAGGGFFSLAILSTGAVDSWGDNGYGELGNAVASCGTDPCAGSKIPVAVTGVGGTGTLSAIEISGGYESGYAMTSGGGIVAWGEASDFKQLGNGGSTNSTSPVNVTGLTSGVPDLQPSGSSMGENGRVIGATVAAPTVTSVSPTSGSTAGGTSVTITGTNFTGATAVTFGSTAASSYTVNSATQITATSPAESAATIDITVTTGGGTSATSASDQFTFTASPPTVTAVSPTSGSTSGGTSVTVTGTNFTGATAVKFGTTAATSYTVNSATQITATSPAEAAATIDITVTTPAGTSATSASDHFTFSTGPSYKVYAKGGSSVGTDVGTTIYTGGAGGTGAGTVNNGNVTVGGGGGGSSAGTGSNGNAGTNTGTAGAAVAGGGAGGAGGPGGGASHTGSPGSAPGGGGGGGAYRSGVSYAGGAGGTGQVVVIETGGATTTYSTAGTTTYTVPAGITQITIRAWGGGAGGFTALGYDGPGGLAGGTNSSFGGDGGAGGDFTQTVLAVSAGQSFTVVVGAGGASDLAGGDSYVQ